MIYHEIKTKDLETHVIWYIVGLGHPVLMAKVWLSCDDGFDDDVLDISPVLVCLQAQCFEGLEKLCKWFLMAVTQIIHWLIKQIFRAALINGIVGEMHAEIVNIFIIWVFVFFSWKPDQSLVIDVNAHGVTAPH